MKAMIAKEEEEGVEKKPGGEYQNHHLGPKTRETELRLGISFDGGSNGVGPGETRSLLKQRINGGFGNKRWFSETGDGFEPPWRSPEKRVAEPPSAVAPRAPAVVGWPPVRAFRRNMVLQPKPEMDSKVTADGGDAPLPQAPTKAAEEQMYVKVNMEGYAVGRKINLRAHNGYDSLSCALQRMFNNFFSMTCSDHEQISEEDEEFKSDYVLIYEDNEGDRLLVGDVPWEMFINSVKRLYIINGATAPRLVSGKSASYQHCVK